MAVCNFGVYKLIDGSSFLRSYYCSKSKYGQMLYLTSFNKARDFNSITKFSKCLTTNHIQLIFLERGSVFSAIYDFSNWQYCKLGRIRYIGLGKLGKFFFFDIPSSVNFTERFTRNSRSFDSEIRTSVNSTLQQLLFQQTHFFFLLWLTIAQKQDGNIPKDFKIYERH